MSEETPDQLPDHDDGMAVPRRRRDRNEDADPQTTRRLMLLVIPLVTAAAAIVAVVVLRAPDRERAGEATRVKGGDHLGFYIERDGVALPGADGDIVHPGERVRFTVTVHSPAHVAIGSIDDDGHAFVYYPASADLGVWPAAVERALPDAIELDGSLGRERVFAWFCDRALDAASVRGALAAPDHALTGCRSDSLTWDKHVR